MSLQKLKDKIYQTLPELKELKFGCEVEIDDMLGEKKSILYTTDDEVCVQYFHPHSKKWLQFIEYKKGFAKRNKILGQPIGLPEVLRCLDKIGKDYFAVRNNGEFMRWDGSLKGNHLTKIYWNLEKPLDGQSEETINFLSEIFLTP